MSMKLESRWNKRGIKKCPKCGIYNGNRAVHCKNKLCRQMVGVVKNLKIASAASDQLIAVQIKNGHQQQSVKLYSVRMLGIKTVRGFVEIRDCDEASEQLLQLKTGICYVDCHPHIDPEGTCQHVRVASETKETAEGLTIHREFLDMLNVTPEERETIWKQQLSCSAENPLVQKVSADTFVVKCDDEFHQPVPYCHVQLKQPSSILYDCQILDAYEGSSSCYHAVIVAAACISSAKHRRVFETIVQHLLITLPQKPSDQIPEQISILDSMVLLHNELTTDDGCPLDKSQQLNNNGQFLITIDDPPTINCADIQLVDCNLELKTDLATIDFIHPCEHDNVSTSPVIELINNAEKSSEAFTENFDDNLQLMDCQIELMDQFNLTDQIDFCPSDIELSDDNLVFPADEELGLAVREENNPSETCVSKSSTKNKSKLVDVTTKKTALRQSSKIPKEKMKKGSYNVRKLMKILESNGVVFNRLKRCEAVAMVTSPDIDISPTTRGVLPSFEATLCNLTFTTWLESVIEQLNSVIVYSGNGKPDTQTFNIHENFFQCLRARFSVGHRLRTPDHIFEVPGGPRRGLTCQVYKFLCYKSLRNVLKTDKEALKFNKSFCRTPEGRFDEIDLSDAPSVHGCSTKGRRVLIKAFEFKTYIKMGTYKHDPCEKVNYFLIEWIAGVLPRCGFGEMRITFEFGHKENSLYVTPPVQAPIGSKSELQTGEGISA